MSRPNSLRLTSQEDDDDAKDEVSPFLPSRPRKPLVVNDNIINFSLNRQKEQQARTASEQNQLTPNESPSKVGGESDKSASEDTKRGKAGKRLRSLLKGNRSRLQQSEGLESGVSPAGANRLAAVVGLASANKLSQDTSEAPPDGDPALSPAEESIAAVPVAASETTAPKLELVPPLPETTEQDDLPITPSETVLESAATAEVPPAAAAPNIAPASANTPPAAANLAPPPPPTGPPRTPNYGGGGGGANLPPGINPANLAPPAAYNAAHNQAPVVIEKGSGVGPALIAFLAATYFRRRGERRQNRLRKKGDAELDNKIDKTKDQLKQTQNQVNSEAERLRRTEQTVQNQSREQLAAASINTKNNRSTTDNQQIVQPAENLNVLAAEQKPEGLTRPVKAAEILAATPIGIELAREATKQVRQTERQNTEHVLRTERQQSEQLQQESNKKTELFRQTLREKGLDRHHEIKDDSAVRAGAAGIPASSVSAARAAQAASLSLPHNTSPSTGSGIPDNQPSSNSTSASTSQQDMYKQSMRTGILVGISVIVLGVVAYLLI